jgi:hypothetical protein
VPAGWCGHIYLPLGTVRSVLRNSLGAAMPKDDTGREMMEALRLEPFVVGGRAQLVKVLALRDGSPPIVSGYVVQQKFLLGLRPVDIERRLGLIVGSIQQGCRILTLTRQPGPSEAVYELTTEYPGGLAYTMLSDVRYPPSDKRFVHQWRLVTPISVRRAIQLGPNDSYSDTL